jgi:hypothetical protein
MPWDRRLEDLFDDLEQQADGLALAQRDAEVAELARAEYAQVDLAARLHGSLGRRLVLDVLGAGAVEGSLSRVGRDWCLIDTGSNECLVRLAATRSLRGLAAGGPSLESRRITARLGLASALRTVAQSRLDSVLLSTDGSATRGRLERVGADFVDIRAGEGDAGHLQTVPFGAVAAVRTW